MNIAPKMGQKNAERVCKTNETRNDRERERKKKKCLMCPPIRQHSRQTNKRMNERTVVS